MLGASTWRIEEITRDRVLVSPAPGAPGAVPFWKGEGVGRPYELGARIGAASRELAALSDEKAAKTLTGDYHLDALATRNLLAFLREQERASALPTDRTVVVERFKDEIGDWRVCVLTPFGGRVHAPWSMALAARLRDSLGLEVQSLWSDDGIALHFADADAPPPLSDLLLEPDELENLVVQEVGSTALFGARFRENAARALLIPRRRPGQRTPLWQQRLKAQSLLEVARKYGSFPIVLETYRECLQDVFDLPALRGLLRGLSTREIDLVEVETPSASPMASSLLFDYVATYMYEDDTPAAERRAQALSLDRELLRELLGQEELRDLLDPGALAEVEGSLLPQPRKRRRAARPPAACRRPPRRRARRRVRRDARARAACLPGPGRWGRGDHRRRGRRPLPGRVRRDATGRPPRDVPRARHGCVRACCAPVRALAGAVHDRCARRAVCAAAGGRRGAPRRPRGPRPAREGRAAPRRRRAGVVRSGCPAPHPAGVPRGSPPPGRAGRAGGSRPIPAGLARDRPSRDAARGARPAPGAGAPGGALGERDPPAPGPGVPARGARPALRLGGGPVGRLRPRPRRALLP